MQGKVIGNVRQYIYICLNHFVSTVDLCNTFTTEEMRHVSHHTSTQHTDFFFFAQFCDGAVSHSPTIIFLAGNTLDEHYKPIP